MNQATFDRVVPLSAIMAVAFAAMSYSAGAQVEVDHKIVASSGDAAPTGGTYLPLFPNAKLNTRHLVAFDAFVNGPPITTGVFVGDGRTASTVVLGNNPNPTAPSFGFVGNSFITHTGDVVFQTNASDVCTSDGRTVVPVVRNGDPAPGGGTLAPKGTLAANGHGAIVYLANINSSAATRGVFRRDLTRTVAIARDDNDAPIGGRFTLMFRRPVINDRGQVAFSAEVTGGPADFGVFLGDGAGLMPVFAANRVAPGGATFEDFGDPVINRHGQLAAFASLSNSASRGGLFIGAGTDAVAIALQGEAAPKGGSYREHDAFLGAIRLNDRGEVAFVCEADRRFEFQRHLSWQRVTARRQSRCWGGRAGNDRRVPVVRRNQTWNRRSSRLCCNVGGWRGRRGRVQQSWDLDRHVRRGPPSGGANG